MEAVEALVRRDDVRLVSLLGPGGVGKTRLALTVAERAVGPVYWIELAGLARADDVPAALIRTLGAEQLAGETAEDALARFLEPKAMLVVVDNLEHVLAAAPLLGRLAAQSPRLTMLTTSREPLELALEHRFAVRPLEAPAAQELFAELAARRDPGFELTPAVSEICRRLDGLPLAIELAAARTSLFSPEQLLGRLDDAMSALGRGGRDAPERQRTLRATLEWSHQLLDHDARAALAAFSVFAGGADFEATEAVTGATVDTLQALVDKHLLQRSANRLTMLRTVRVFAHERLTDDVRDRHLDYYVALAEAAECDIFRHDEARWLRRLDQDADNLFAALSWGAERRPEAALRLAASLGPYWYIRDIAEGQRQLQAALEAAGERAPDRDRARAFSQLAFLRNAWQLDGTDAAERALAAACRAGAVELQCAARLGLAAAAAWQRRDVEAALAHAERALADAIAADDQWQVAMAHYVMAGFLPIEQASTHIERAVEGLRRHGSRYFLANLYSNLAYGAIAERGYGEAQRMLDEAIGLLDPSYAHLTAIVHGNLGLARLLTGRTNEAVPAFLVELRFAGEQINVICAAEGLAGLAAVAAAEGDHRRCARLLGAARGLGPYADAALSAELERCFYAQSRLVLGEPEWEATMRAGAALSLVEVVSLAIQEQRPAVD